MIFFPEISSMPRPLAEHLLAGTYGYRHLLAAAEMALAVARRCDTVDIAEYQMLARDLVLAAWESDPLNGSLARRVLQLHSVGNRALLDPEVARCVGCVAKTGNAPIDAQSLMEAMRAGDTKAVRAWFGDNLQGAGQAWVLRQAVLHGFFEGAFQWVDDLLCRVDTEDIAPVLQRLRGEVLLLREQPEDAVEFFEKSSRDGMGEGVLPGTLERKAEALRRAGRHAEAAQTLHSVVQLRPWHVSAVLAEYDLATGMSDAVQPPDGTGVVLFYTWNKARDLDLALAALADSELYGTRVTVLDNGSTDDTPAVLEKWKQRLNGRCVFDHLRLPVNVGAPAARNWLASLESVQKADWVAYLDDDALVPPDWLGRLGAAMQAYPAAGAWGARIMDHERPYIFQSADLFLLDPKSADSDVSSPEQRQFRVSGLQHQVLDFGQFRHTRPCASVTGCVHLLRTTVLQETGGFDVRYAPSQYDDLDHDLRLCLAGRLPVYQGHLGVRHMKRTGKHTTANDSGAAGPLGNMYKLQSRHAPERFAAIRATVYQAVMDDFRQKRDFLAVISTI